MRTSIPSRKTKRMMGLGLSDYHKIYVSLRFRLSFVFFLYLNFSSGQETNKPASPEVDFQSCDQAVVHAQTDIENGSKRWIESIFPDTHDKYFDSDTSYYYQRRADFDSLMYAIYEIRVVRERFSWNGWMNGSYAKGCYNRVIKNHMDSIVGYPFNILVWNALAKIHGEEPYFSEEDIEKMKRERN